MSTRIATKCHHNDLSVQQKSQESSSKSQIQYRRCNWKHIKLGQQLAYERMYPPPRSYIILQEENNRDDIHAIIILMILWF